MNKGNSICLFENNEKRTSSTFARRDLKHFFQVTFVETHRHHDEFGRFGGKCNKICRVLFREGKFQFLTTLWRQKSSPYRYISRDLSRVKHFFWLFTTLVLFSYENKRQYTSKLLHSDPCPEKRLYKIVILKEAFFNVPEVIKLFCQRQVKIIIHHRLLKTKFGRGCYSCLSIAVFLSFCYEVRPISQKISSKNNLQGLWFSYRLLYFP